MIAKFGIHNCGFVSPANLRVVAICMVGIKGAFTIHKTKLFTRTGGISAVIGTGSETCCW